MIPRENRPMTSAVIDSLGPKEDEAFGAGSIAMVTLVPFTILGDAIFVHPALEMDDAYRCASRVCWSSFGQEGHYPSDCTFLLVRVIASPLIYLANWGYRCVDAVPPYPIESDESEPEPVKRTQPAQKSGPEPQPDYSKIPKGFELVPCP